MYKQIYDNLCTSKKKNKLHYGRGSGLHRHHVVPIHDGGSDDEENATYLTIREHGIAHFLLWKAYGRMNDLRAMHMLGVNLTPIQRHRLGKWCHENKIGIHGASYEQRLEWTERGRQTQLELGGYFRNITPEQRRCNAKAAGRIGGTKQRDLGMGIHGASEEKRKEYASMGGKSQLGMKWIMKAGVNKKVWPEEIPHFLADGWVLGANRGRWYNKNTTINEIKSLLDNGYEVEVDSPDGYVPVTLFVDKGEWDEYVLQTASGSTVRVNEAHLFKSARGEWISAKELAGLGATEVMTANGTEFATVTKTGCKIPIVDINVDHENHRYYTNGVESHNTNVGKSLGLCHLAANYLMQGKNVLYITLEMAEERIAERVDANLMDTPISDIPFISKENFFKKLENIARKTTGNFYIKEYPTASAHSGHFRHLIEELRLKKNFNVDVLLIDYINICSSSRMKYTNGVNSYNIVKSVAEELRGLGVEFNVPVWTATQTNRQGYSDSDFDLDSSAESFGVPQTADFMLALIATEELTALNQFMAKQLKNRYRDKEKTKRFVIGVDKSKQRFYNVEQVAQEGIQNEATPVFDRTEMGSLDRTQKKTKFDSFGFDDPVPF